jgi:hypothetical protein
MALLRYCDETGHSMFTNGAGKQLVAGFLNFCLFFGEPWFTKTSTTNVTRSDWCGVVPRAGEPKMTGVVDALLEMRGGTKLLCAEVKLGLQRVPAECQLLAGLRMFQGRQPNKPILGLLLNPVEVVLYVPQGKRGGVCTYHTITRSVRNFKAVVELFDTAFGFIHHFHSAKLPVVQQGNEMAVLERLTRLEENSAAMSQQLRGLAGQMVTIVQKVTYLAVRDEPEGDQRRGSQ